MSEVEKSESEVFTETFNTLAETGEVPGFPVEAKVEEPTPVVEEESHADDKQEPVSSESDAPVPADDAQPETEAVAGAEKKEEPAPQKEPQKAGADQDIIDRLAQAVKDRVQSPVPEQQPQQPETYEPQPVLTQEDYKSLEAFEKDWPDVAKAMELRAKEQANAIVNHVFKEFADEARPYFKAVAEMRQQLHAQQLQQKVEDYPVVREQVMEWAKKQTPVRRAVYDQIINRGTPDEVAELVSIYKADTAPPPAPVAPVAPAAPKQLSPAVKKAAAALAPVASKRSNVVHGDDPMDFDGAFKEANKFFSN